MTTDNQTPKGEDQEKESYDINISIEGLTKENYYEILNRIKSIDVGDKKVSITSPTPAEEKGADEKAEISSLRYLLNWGEEKPNTHLGTILGTVDGNFVSTRYHLERLWKRLTAPQQEAAQGKDVQFSPKGWISVEEMLSYGEWARGNGERFRGNLQKNGTELYNQYLKEKESWKKLQ